MSDGMDITLAAPAECGMEFHDMEILSEHEMVCDRCYEIGQVKKQYSVRVICLGSASMYVFARQQFSLKVKNKY